MGSCSDRSKLILLPGAVAERLFWTGATFLRAAFVNMPGFLRLTPRVSPAPIPLKNSVMDFSEQ
jgi:hypothetical protein